MKRFKEKRILIGLGLAFAVLIFVQLVLLGNAAEQKRMVAYVAKTRDFIEKLHQLVTYLSEAETGRRGYVMSGQDRYLAHHSNRVNNAYQALKELQELAADEPAQVAAGKELEALMAQRLTISSNSIRARHQGL
jgi:CHASE3 domain sensor protein